MRAKRGGACTNPRCAPLPGSEELSHAKINRDNRYRARGGVNLPPAKHARYAFNTYRPRQLLALELAHEIVIVLEECINYLFMKIFRRRSA